jgi:beta-glucosidase
MSDFSGKEATMSRFIPFRLPDSLVLGCATAATQIEGGDKNNSWYAWAQKPGKIEDGTSPERANQHWNRFEQDLSLMSHMGIKHYRFGIEWSRIEPSEGVFDDAAMEHYRTEIKCMLSHGIQPLVTLHHFSNPIWFEKKGAFEHKSCIPIFRRYASYVISNLSDLCSDFVTINEPNVYAVFGYVYGTWPPGQTKLLRSFRVLKHLTLCHLHTYQDIHAAYKDRPVRVGFANHLRVFVPYGKGPIDAIQSKIMEYLFQGALTKSMSTGQLAFPVGFGAPLGKGRFYDYIGINYYTRSVTRNFSEMICTDLPTNDLGWDIYPEGLSILCKEQYKKYRAPIWITENGTCDKEDDFRSAFIYDHLKQIRDDALPVERYYHWTFMDNFEWAEGESAPFGLVACDFATQTRKIRPSGHFYHDLIREKGVTQAMINHYLDKSK